MNELISADADDWLLFLLTSPTLLGRFVQFPEWEQKPSPDAFWVSEAQSQRVH